MLTPGPYNVIDTWPKDWAASPDGRARFRHFSKIEQIGRKHTRKLVCRPRRRLIGRARTCCFDHGCTGKAYGFQVAGLSALAHTGSVNQLVGPVVLAARAASPENSSGHSREAQWCADKGYHLSVGYHSGRTINSAQMVPHFEEFKSWLRAVGC
jgi:hypothetical protein